MEWNAGTILTLIGGTAIAIGSLLGWWTIRGSMGFMSINMDFNPLYGMVIMGIPVIPPTFLTIICGILALAGGSLTFIAIKKPILGKVGGLLAIAGILIFIAAFYIENIGAGYLIYDFGLFDSTVIGSYDYTSFLSYGWFIVVAGAIVGIIGSSKIEVLY